MQLLWILGNRLPLPPFLTYPPLRKQENLSQGDLILFGCFSRHCPGRPSLGSSPGGHGPSPASWVEPSGAPAATYLGRRDQRRVDRLVGYCDLVLASGWSWWLVMLVVQSLAPIFVSDSASKKSGLFEETCSLLGGVSGAVTSFPPHTETVSTCTPALGHSCLFHAVWCQFTNFERFSRRASKSNVQETANSCVTFGSDSTSLSSRLPSMNV